MKMLAASVAASLFLIPSGNALEPGPWKIHLTGSRVSMQGANSVYALYNRPAYPGQIGTAFAHCTRIGKFFDCEETLRLTQGQLVARGISAPSAGFRQLAVTGGTGLYANVGGEMIVQQVGDTGQLVLVDLVAFG